MLTIENIRDMVFLDREVPDVWMLQHNELPYTVNQARRWHHQKLAKQVKKWREIGWALSLEAKVPKMGSAELHFVTLVKQANRDYASEVLTAKAMTDGAITDAGVMPDDRPPYVTFAGFHAPIKFSSNGMAMFIVRLS